MLQSFQATQQMFVLEDGTVANHHLTNDLLDIFDEVFQEFFPTKDSMNMVDTQFQGLMKGYWNRLCERIGKHGETMERSDEANAQFATVVKNLETRRDFQEKHEDHGVWLFSWSLPWLLHESLLQVSELVKYVSEHAALDNVVRCALSEFVCMQFAPLVDPDFCRSSGKLGWPRKVHDEGEALLYLLRPKFRDDHGRYNWVSPTILMDVDMTYIGCSFRVFSGIFCGGHTLLLPV